MQIDNIIISDNQVDLSLEKFLLKKYPNLNYIFIQKLIRTGQIRVNGKRIKQAYILKPNDNIRIPIFRQSNNNLKKQQEKKLNKKAKELIDYLRKNLLYKDQHMIAINKPSGLAVQGGKGISISLDNLLPYLIENDSSAQLKLIHRLDKETSGVLLIARSDRGAKYLFEQFKNRIIKKVYHCLVSGVPSEKTGIIRTSLLQIDTKVISTNLNNNDAKEAITKYNVLYNNKNISYLEVIPETGRKHQIRSHLGLNLKTPIIGDYKYGFDRNNIDSYLPKNKIFLHSREVYFKNINNKNTVITANFDKIWESTIDILYNKN